MADGFCKYLFHSLSIASAFALGACGGGSSTDSERLASNANSAESVKPAARASKQAGSYIAVVARGSLAANLGPVMQVRANGQLIGTIEVRSPTYQTYYFSTSELLPNGSRVEVSFINDAVVSGADRNLYVQSINVDGKTFASTSSDVRYVRGWDEINGQEDMLWNGSLRFSLAADSASERGFSWETNGVWQENFESPSVLTDWRFNPGAEFGGGARGQVSLVPAASGGKVLELAYSTNVFCEHKNCPVYAAAVHKLKAPAHANNLRFRLRNNLARDARVYATVKHSAGQTFQYRPERCPFETAADDWCLMDMDLRLPAMHWGGSNSGQIQGPITEVSVLVQALNSVRGRVAIEGKLQIDDVALSTTPTSVALHRQSVNARWRDVSIDSNHTKLGVAVHFSSNRPDNQTLLHKAREAGFGFVRTDLFWSRIERERGRYDFVAADQLVADARAQGLQVLFILDYDNPLHKNGVLMSTDSERNAFAAYAAAAAARFKGQGVKFEIWNEQNSGSSCPSVPEGFWLPRPNADHYGQLVTATMRAIRSVDSEVQVSIGGLVTSFTSSCETTEPTLFSFQYIDLLHRAGGLNSVNALGYHPYYDFAEEWGAELQMLRTLLRDKGFPSMPVWETEWGISSACPDNERPCSQGHSSAKRQRQAVRLARRMLVALSMGLPVNVWYDLIDDGEDPNDRGQNFGLYDRQFKSKPALAAMKTLSSVSAGRLSGVMSNLPAGLHALRFQKGADTTYVIWLERGSIQLNLDLNGLHKAVDVQGKDLPLSNVWTLRETDGPIYLTCR